MRSRNATSRLDHAFYALSDPTRRSILAVLSRGEANLTSLAERSKLSFPAVAKHIKVLERGRLIRRKPDRLDRRAVLFELRPAALSAGIDWLERHRRYWQARLAELDAFVSANYRPRERGP